MSYTLEDKSRMWRILGGLLAILLYLSPKAVGISFPLATHTLACVGLVCMLGIGWFGGLITITLRDIIICLCLLSPFVCVGIIQFLVIHEIAGLKYIALVALNLVAALTLTKYFSWELYSKAFRWSIPFNIILISAVLLLGSISFDPTIHTIYDPGLFMDWKNFHFTLAPSSLALEKVRTGGIFGHANIFGMVATIGMLGLYIGKERTSLMVRISWWVLFIFSFVITESRSSLLMLLVFMVANNILQSWNSIKKVVKNIVVVGGVFCILLTVAFMRFDEQTGDITSGRAGIMDIVSAEVLDGLPTTQAFGVGLGLGISYLEQQYGFMIPVDNSYFRLLIDAGLLGTLMFLFVVAFWFWRARKNILTPQYTYGAFVLGMVAHSLFESDFMIDFKSFIWLPFLLYATQDTVDDKNYNNHESSRDLHHI